MLVGVVLGLALCGNAFAQDDPHEGLSCSTSAECGQLQCIEGTCRDARAIVEGDERSHVARTLGDRAMFGDGHGYGTAIAITDIATALTVPILLGIGTATSSTGLLIAAVIPPSLAGPAIHFAYGRPIPGIISFFAWSSVTFSTAAFSVFVGLFSEGLFNFNGFSAAAAGAAFGTLGAGLMTWLDVYMARSVKRAPPKDMFGTPISFAPGVVPVRGGALASFGGTW